VSKKKVHKLSIFLLKENIVSAEFALKDASNLKRIDISIDKKHLPLYYKENYPSQPSWVKFFNGYAGTLLDKLKNQGTAAVFFVESKNRLFAITFDYGRSLIKNDCFEENFGFRVVLNSVNPNEIRSADAQTLDAIPVHRRTQASTATSMREMGIDADQDLLYAVTGKPKNNMFGAQITGKDALRISAAVDIDTLPQLLEKLFTAFVSEEYKNYFWWVDNLSEIRDPALLSELDIALGEKISSADYSRTWLAIPDVIDWEDFGGFKYQRAKREKPNEDINWDGYLKFVGSDNDLTAETFKKHHVLHMSKSSEREIRSWTVYQCIYCELEIESQSYVLSNGKWYRIKNDFVSELNEKIGGIPLTASLSLPEYRDENEEMYNKRVGSENPTLACMDRKQIFHGGARSQIEFCDLYTPDKRLIHVKRYGGSSVLSHLFAQGVVSVELLLSDIEFRKKANKKLPKAHQLPETKPDPSDYEIVYAIISKDLMDLRNLPLFSRITLKNSYQRLSLMGVRASVFIVPIAADAEIHFSDKEDSAT